MSGNPLNPRNPRIGATSFTTTSFRWLHEEAWDNEQKAAFLRFRQAPACGLYAPAAYVRQRRGADVVAPQRWLLHAGKTEPGLQLLADNYQAAAEATVLRRNFTTLQILFAWQPGRPDCDTATLRQSLAFLISGLIILCSADVVRLVPIARATGADASIELRELKDLIASFGFGTLQTLWTPVATPERLAANARGGVDIPILTIDPTDWWENDVGAKDRQALAYLEKRLQVEEELAKAAAAPPRGGFLARLSRFLSWG